MTDKQAFKYGLVLLALVIIGAMVFGAMAPKKLREAKTVEAGEVGVKGPADSLDILFWVSLAAFAAFAVPALTLALMFIFG